MSMARGREDIVLIKNFTRKLFKAGPIERDYLVNRTLSQGCVGFPAC